MLQSQSPGSRIEWNSNNLVPVKEVVVRVNHSPWCTDTRYKANFILQNQCYDGETFAFKFDYDSKLFRLTPSHGVVRPRTPTTITLTVAANTAKRIRKENAWVTFRPVNPANPNRKSFWNNAETSSSLDYVRLDVVFLPDKNNFEPKRSIKNATKSENFIEKNRKLYASSIKKTKSLQVKAKSENFIEKNRKLWTSSSSIKKTKSRLVKGIKTPSNKPLPKESISFRNKQNTSVTKTSKSLVKRSASKWLSKPEGSVCTKSSRTSNTSKPKYLTSKSKSRSSKSSLLKGNYKTSVSKDMKSCNDSVKSRYSQRSVSKSDAISCGSNTKKPKFTVKHKTPNKPNPKSSVSKESRRGTSKKAKLISKQTPPSLLGITYSEENKELENRDLKSSISKGDTKNCEFTVTLEQKCLESVFLNNSKSSLKVLASQNVVSKSEAKSCESTKSHKQNTPERSFSKTSRSSVKRSISQKTTPESNAEFCGSDISHQQKPVNKSVAKRSNSSVKSCASKIRKPEKSTSKKSETDYPFSLLKGNYKTSVSKDVKSCNDSVKSRYSQRSVSKSDANSCGSKKGSNEHNVIVKKSKSTVKRETPNRPNPKSSVSKESRRGTSKKEKVKLISKQTPPSLLGIPYSEENKELENRDIRSSISKGDTKNCEFTATLEQKCLESVFLNNSKSSLKVLASQNVVSKSEEKGCESNKSHKQNTLERSVSKTSRSSVKRSVSQKATPESNSQFYGSTISHKKKPGNKSVAKRSNSSVKSCTSKIRKPEKSTSKKSEFLQKSPLLSSDSKERNKKLKKGKKRKKSNGQQTKQRLQKFTTKTSAENTFSGKTMALRNCSAWSTSNVFSCDNSDLNISFIKACRLISNCKASKFYFDSHDVNNNCSDNSFLSSAALENPSSKPFLPSLGFPDERKRRSRQKRNKTRGGNT